MAYGSGAWEADERRLMNELKWLFPLISGTRESLDVKANICAYWTKGEECR